MAKRNGYLGENVYVEEVTGTAGEALQYYGSTYAGCRCLLGPCRERHLRGGELNNCQTRVAVVTEREEENGILPLG